MSQHDDQEERQALKDLAAWKDSSHDPRLKPHDPAPYYRERAKRPLLAIMAAA